MLGPAIINADNLNAEIFHISTYCFFRTPFLV